MANSLLSRLKGALSKNGVTGAEVVEGNPVQSQPQNGALKANCEEENTGAVDKIDQRNLTPFEARQTANQRSGKTFFKWSRNRSPTSQTMIVAEYKLIYQPIAKNACTSTKRMVAELGGFRPKQNQGIHVALDSQKTGLQFKDRSHDEVTAALIDPTWMRFVIYREPLDRLVSAYVEKFVQNRSHPNQWKTTISAIQAIFEKEEPTEEDYEHGITFREFAEYILAENPNHLDSHWQPQIYYLGNIPFTHMYDVKALHRLETDLQEHLGAKVEIPRVNVSRGKQSEPEYVRIAPDLLPRDLGNARNLSIDSFLDDDLRTRLTEYYAADISIYRLVQSVNGAIVRHQ